MSEPLEQKAKFREKLGAIKYCRRDVFYRIRDFRDYLKLEFLEPDADLKVIEAWIRTANAMEHAHTDGREEQDHE